MNDRGAASEPWLSSDQYRALIYTNNGSAPFDVWYATQIVLDVQLTNRIVEQWPLANEWLVNILFIVAPCLCRLLTPFNRYHLAFNFVQAVAIAILRNYRLSQTVCETWHRDPKRLSILTVLRSSLFLITSLAILAVDFRIFYLPFAKTDRYGYSLMDTGIGLFALVNGSSHRQLTVSRIGWLLGLGLSRWCAVTATGYHFNVTEYGTHWNFFLTMFVLKASLNFVRIRRPLLMSVLVAGLYEFALHWFDWKTIIFERDASRDTFLAANREGIYTLPGFLALYLFGIYVRSLLETGRSQLRTFTVLGSITFALHAALVHMSDSLQPSRKLVNVSYSLWIVFIFCSIASTLLVTRLAQHDSTVPLVFRIINSNSLAYFLAANLLTGAINLAIDTLAISDPLVSFTIVFVYALVLIRFFNGFMNNKIKC